jgi:hypothetical protein
MLTLSVERMLPEPGVIIRRGGFIGHEGDHHGIGAHPRGFAKGVKGPETINQRIAFGYILVSVAGAVGC